MTNSTNQQVAAYHASAQLALGAALQRKLNVNTLPLVDVTIPLSDPVSGSIKNQAVTVAFSAPTGTAGQVWLNVSPQSPTYEEFLVYTNGGWNVIPPGSLVYNPASIVGVTATNVTPNATTSSTATSGTVQLTTASNRLQRFNNALTANTVVATPVTGGQDGMEFEIVRDAGTPGAFTLTISDVTSGKSYTIASNTRGFCKMRCIGAGGWIVSAAGTLP